MNHRALINTELMVTAPIVITELVVTELSKASTQGSQWACRKQHKTHSAHCHHRAQQSKHTGQPMGKQEAAQDSQRCPYATPGPRLSPVHAKAFTQQPCQLAISTGHDPHPSPTKCGVRCTPGTRHLQLTCKIFIDLSRLMRPAPCSYMLRRWRGSAPSMSAWHAAAQQPTW